MNGFDVNKKEVTFYFKMTVDNYIITDMKKKIFTNNFIHILFNITFIDVNNV